MKERVRTSPCAISDDRRLPLEAAAGNASTN